MYYDLYAGTFSTILPEREGRCLAVSSDGKSVVTSDSRVDGMIRADSRVVDRAVVMQVDDLKGRREIGPFSGPLCGAAFSKDDRVLICATRRGFLENNTSISAWNVADNKQTITTFESYPSEINFNSIALSKDGKRLITGHRDGTMVVWDADTGRILQRLIGDGRPVMSVAFVDEPADRLNVLAGP